MLRSYFHLVGDFLRRPPLYCDISRDEIERHLYKYREYDGIFNIPWTDDDGQEVSIPLRLVVQKSHESKLESISIALLLHDVRIACIDHEPRFTDVHGKLQRGWHKHLWDDSESTADHQKVSLNGFAERFEDQTNLLIHAFKELGIQLSARDYGTPEQADLF
jgi:hypothetical protein